MTKDTTPSGVREAVAGFGDTPEAAMRAFDDAWWKKTLRPPEASELNEREAVVPRAAALPGMPEGPTQ